MKCERVRPRPERCWAPRWPLHSHLARFTPKYGAFFFFNFMWAEKTSAPNNPTIPHWEKKKKVEHISPVERLSICQPLRHTSAGIKCSEEHMWHAAQPYLCARICVAAGNCSSGMSCHISHTRTCRSPSSWSSFGTDRSRSPSCRRGRTCSLGFHQAILPAREPPVSDTHIHSRTSVCRKHPAKPKIMPGVTHGFTSLRTLSRR